MIGKEVVSANLKRLREANGFTQSLVAKYLKIGRSAYSNYESGQRETPYTVVEGLCNLYGCEPQLLYEDDTDELNNILATSFSVDNLSAQDMKCVAQFKNVVKNYLKMERLLAK